MRVANQINAFFHRFFLRNQDDLCARRASCKGFRFTQGFFPSRSAAGFAPGRAAAGRMPSAGTGTAFIPPCRPFKGRRLFQNHHSTRSLLCQRKNGFPGKDPAGPASRSAAVPGGGKKKGPERSSGPSFFSLSGRRRFPSPVTSRNRRKASLRSSPPGPGAYPGRSLSRRAGRAPGNCRIPFGKIPG